MKNMFETMDDLMSQIVRQLKSDIEVGQEQIGKLQQNQQKLLSDFNQHVHN
jgi:uncharacterized protein YoxC